MTGVTAPPEVVIQSLSLGGDGPAVIIKDCIDIEGYVTSCGSAALAGADPALANADVVDALLDHRCHIIGKANMHELAFGMTGVNDHYGTPVNPRWPDLIPGGSSSGSAVAVAAGLCDFAVGTDTGGSVRQPAACCGVFGIKPTFGRISRSGLLPAETTLDCVGALARDMETIEQAMAAMDPEYRSSSRSQVPSIAWVEDECDPEIAAYLTQELGRAVQKMTRVRLAKLSDAFAAGMTIISSEASSSFGYLANGQYPLGDDVRQRLKAGMNISTAQLEEAEYIRGTFTGEVDALLEQYDVLAMPALPVCPPHLKDAADPMAILPLTRYLRPFNLSGHPAICLPAVSAEGLPVGLQLVGKKGQDDHLCAISRWITQAVPMFQSEDSNHAI